MIIALGSDHGGFALKKIIGERLLREGHEVLDLGTDSPNPVDYPDFSRAVGRAVMDGKARRGIIICGSGVGASVAANKMPGIRAGLCHDSFSAHQGVEDDDMNVICLGARVIGRDLAWDLIRAFLSARFSEADRHRRRLSKVAELERKERCSLERTL